MQVPDVRRHLHDRLAVELADEPQDAVRRRVLRTDVDEHLLGVELWLGYVERRERAPGGEPVHAHLGASPDLDFDGPLGHQAPSSSSLAPTSARTTSWGWPPCSSSPA